MTTPILGITEIAAAQVNQYAVANAAFRALENASNDFSTVDLSAGNVTLTGGQLAGGLLFRSAGNAVARDLTIPVATRLFVVHNDGSATLSVKRGSTAVAIAAGERAFLFVDGTTNGLVLIASSASSAPATFTGGTLTDALNEAPITTLASAATTDIGAEDANTINITGTTTITSLGTIASGARRAVVFSDALTLTHDAGSLILPTGANITTAPGDAAEFVSLGSGSWRCLGYERASGEALSGGGGGGGGGGALTNFTEAIGTSAPNATVPVASLSAANAATNVDLAVIPKGAGALIAALPNNAAGGGNKRGSNATDWQRQRAAAIMVASGSSSTISGGESNRASGARSAVGGGSDNIASHDYATVGGGVSNTASATSSTVGGGNTNTVSGTGGTVAGGQNNTASGAHSSVGGGLYNTADAQYSSIEGGSHATTRGVIGAESRANGYFGAFGDAQRGRHILRVSTTTATPAPVTSTAGAASATNQPVLPNNSAYLFTARVVARSSADAAAYQITGLIRRGANAASTALEGTPNVTVIAESGGAAAWDVAAVADTTNGGLQIQVTGAAATSIKWVVDLETVEVVG